MRHPLIYLFLLGFTACGGKHSSVNYGKTTVAALVAEKGEPIEEKKVPVTDSKILVYQDNEKFQTKGDIVTHGYKDPQGDQKSLLFWKHKFRNCETLNKKVNEPKGHTLPEYEFSCPAEGVTVIYTEGSESILRVVEYEKK